MATRNANLLLSAAAAAANGLARDNVHQWYGGDLIVVASGNFDGAKVEVVAAIKLPVSGQREDFKDTAKFKDADFVPLKELTEPGRFDLGQLNPCAILVKVSGATANTKVQIAIA